MDLLFPITLSLMSASAAFCIGSVYSGRMLYFSIGRAFFAAAALCFFAAGLVRIGPVSLHGLLEAAHTLWGYFYLTALIVIILIIYLHFSRWRSHCQAIMAIAVPFAAVIIAASIPFQGSARRIGMDLQHNLLPVHIILATIGEILFFFSFAGSLLYLLIEWRLRNKSAMRFFDSLPSLEIIDRFNRWSITRALAFISIGLAIGVSLLLTRFGTPFQASAKEVLLYASWLVITGIMLLRSRTSLDSHRLCVLNGAFFIVFMAAFVAVNILSTAGFHSFK